MILFLRHRFSGMPHGFRGGGHSLNIVSMLGLRLRRWVNVSGLLTFWPSLDKRQTAVNCPHARHDQPVNQATIYQTLTQCRVNAGPALSALDTHFPPCPFTYCQISGKCYSFTPRRFSVGRWTGAQWSDTTLDTSRRSWHINPLTAGAAYIRVLIFY